MNTSLDFNKPFQMRKGTPVEYIGSYITREGIQFHEWKYKAKGYEDTFRTDKDGNFCKGLTLSCDVINTKD